MEVWSDSPFPISSCKWCLKLNAFFLSAYNFSSWVIGLRDCSRAGVGIPMEGHWLMCLSLSPREEHATAPLNLLQPALCLCLLSSAVQLFHRHATVTMPISQVRPQTEIGVKSQSTLERNSTGVVAHSRAVWPPGATGQGLHTSPACQAQGQSKVCVV